MVKHSEIKVRAINADKIVKITAHMATLDAERVRLQRIVDVLDDRIVVDDVKGMSWAAMGRFLGCHPDTAKTRVVAARKRVARYNKKSS